MSSSPGAMTQNLRWNNLFKQLVKWYFDSLRFGKNQIGVVSKPFLVTATASGTWNFTTRLWSVTLYGWLLKKKLFYLFQATAGLDGTVIIYDFVSDFDIKIRCYIQVNLFEVSKMRFTHHCSGPRGSCVCCGLQWWLPDDRLRGCQCRGVVHDLWSANPQHARP